MQNLLLDSWNFFRNHYVAIGLIVLPLFVPVAIIEALYSHYVITDDSDFLVQLVPAFFALLAYPVYTGGTIFYIASTVKGEAMDIPTCWIEALKLWMPFTFMSILLGLALTAGFLLLIIPGIILIGRYSFASFELFLNKKTPLHALGSSIAATKEYVWTILGGYLVIGLILDGSHFLLGALGGNSPLLNSLLAIVYAVPGSMYTIFAFRVYDLAREKEDKGIEKNGVG